MHGRVTAILRLEICQPSGILDFKLCGFQPLRGFRESTENQSIKFQQNPPIHG